jgi:hypothetical protein
LLGTVGSALQHFLLRCTRDMQIELRLLEVSQGHGFLKSVAENRCNDFHLALAAI